MHTLHDVHIKLTSAKPRMQKRYTLQLLHTLVMALKQELKQHFSFTTTNCDYQIMKTHILKEVAIMRPFSSSAASRSLPLLPCLNFATATLLLSLLLLLPLLLLPSPRRLALLLLCGCDS
jgi:hypothetical protein